LGVVKSFGGIFGGTCNFQIKTTLQLQKLNDQPERLSPTKSPATSSGAGLFVIHIAKGF